jgi:hypothetical protein
VEMSYVAGTFAALGELKHQTKAVSEQNRRLDNIQRLLERLVTIEEENFKINHGKEFKPPKSQSLTTTVVLAGGSSGDDAKNKPTLPKGASKK